MKKGFTLIELLVVVLIIGILTSIALPQYNKSIERSRATEAVIAGKATSDALMRFYQINRSYPGSDSTFDRDLDVSIKLGNMKNFNFAYLTTVPGGGSPIITLTLTPKSVGGKPTLIFTQSKGEQVEPFCLGDKGTCVSIGITYCTNFSVTNYPTPCTKG